MYTIQSWLELAEDQEVLTLYRIVWAEMDRRKLPPSSVPPEDTGRSTNSRTPPKNNSS